MSDGIESPTSRQILLSRGISLLASAWVAACSTAAPVLTRPPAFPLNKNAPISVTVNRPEYRPAVEQSIQEAGLRLATSAPEVAYLLHVDIGNSKRGGNCGTLRNVRYRLNHVIKQPEAVSERAEVRNVLGMKVLSVESVQDGALVLELRGRGWVGNCPDGSIFDDMSRALAGEFRAE